MEQQSRLPGTNGPGNVTINRKGNMPGVWITGFVSVSIAAACIWGGASKTKVLKIEAVQNQSLTKITDHELRIGTRERIDREQDEKLSELRSAIVELEQRMDKLELGPAMPVPRREQRRIGSPGVGAEPENLPEPPNP